MPRGLAIGTLLYRYTELFGKVDESLQYLQYLTPTTGTSMFQGVCLLSGTRLSRGPYLSVAPLLALVAPT